MSETGPGLETAEEIAGYCFRRKHTEAQVSDHCTDRGVDPNEVLPAFRRMTANRAGQRRTPTSAVAFLEGRFSLDGTQAISGGQGRVEFGHFKTDGLLGAAVAIKFINRPPDLPSGERHKPAEVSSIVGLPRTTAPLRRNLVEYLAVGYWDAGFENVDVFSVVMPRSRLTLRDLIRARKSPFEMHEACCLIRLLASVADDLNRLGLIHRDLKPENVLLYDPDPIEDVEETLWTVDGVTYRPVVTDLGLAKRVVDEQGRASLTARDQGSANYMAPEQFQGGQLTHQVDVYALGAMLFELLAGKVPFDIEEKLRGESQDVAEATNWRSTFQRNPPATLRDFTGRQFGPRLERVVRKCLRKGPVRRYATAGDLVNDLVCVLSNSPVKAERLGRRLDEEDLCDGDRDFDEERRGRKKWRWYTAAGVVIAAALAYAGWREAGNHRVTKLAGTRLLQDASLDRERMGDDGARAVLLGLALVEAAGQDDKLEAALRVAITLARGRLLPLREIIEVTGNARGCAVSPDGKLAVVGTDKGRVWFVDLAGSGVVSRTATGGGRFYKTGDHERHDSVSAVAFDPSGARFAAATDGGIVHVVDVAEGGEVLKIKHPGQPMSVDFSPDGRLIVVAGRRGDKGLYPQPTPMAIYDSISGKCLQTFPINYELYAAAFSPDGRWLAAGGGMPPNPRLAVWDRMNPNASPQILPQPARVFTLAFRPGRATELVTGDVNGGVRFWALKTTEPGDGSRAETWSSNGPEIRQNMQVRVTSFSGDGALLLVGCEGGRARVWDVEDRSPVGQWLEHQRDVRAGAISLKAGRAVTADHAGYIRVWDLQPARPSGLVLRHPSPVWDATFNDAGDRVLTGCASGVNAPGAGRLWDLSGGEPIRLDHGADVMVARFRPGSSGEVVTCGNDGSVSFWDGATGRPIGDRLSHEDHLVYTASFDATGDRFAFAGHGGVVRVCGLDPAGGVFRVNRREEHPEYSFVWNLRFGPRPGQLFTDGGPSLRAWDLSKAGGTHRDFPPSTTAKSIEKRAETRLGGIDRSGRRILSIAVDGKIAVWDTDNPSAVPCPLGDRPHGSGWPRADWHGASDIIATGGPDGVVRLWRPDGSRPATPDLLHPSPIEVVSFSPDGRWLVTGCQDGGLRLWSVDSGVWTGAGWYHAGPVTRAQFSNDSRRILSASRDGTARVALIPEQTVGVPAAILAQIEADAGIQVAVTGSGTTSSVTAPRPLTPETFRQRREAAGTLK